MLLKQNYSAEYDFRPENVYRGKSRLRADGDDVNVSKR